MLLGVVESRKGEIEVGKATKSAATGGGRSTMMAVGVVGIARGRASVEMSSGGPSVVGPLLRLICTQVAGEGPGGAAKVQVTRGTACYRMPRGGAGYEQCGRCQDSEQIHLGGRTHPVQEDLISEGSWGGEMTWSSRFPSSGQPD